MKYFLLIYLIIVTIFILEAYFCTEEIDDELAFDSFDEKSECCGARYIGETDLCSECKEHTGR